QGTARASPCQTVTGSTGGMHNTGNIINQHRMDTDIQIVFLKLDEFFGRTDGAKFCQMTGRQETLHNGTFLLNTWKSHGELHQETVQLCFRKRKSTGSVDRILGRNNKTRAVKRISDTVHGHLALFHTFHKCGLSSWRSTVDFVRQKNVAEY